MFFAKQKNVNREAKEVIKLQKEKVEENEKMIETEIMDQESDILKRLNQRKERANSDPRNVRLNKKSIEISKFQIKPDYCYNNEKQICKIQCLNAKIKHEKDKNEKIMSIKNKFLEEIKILEEKIKEGKSLNFNNNFN